MKVARVATIPEALCHIDDQLNWLENAGVELTLLCKEGNYPAKVSDSIRRITIPFVRDPSIVADTKVMLQLWGLFRKEQFDVVHSFTPKAGLLCAMAGVLARVPVRLHSFTGQRWLTESGAKRVILKFFDTVIATLCTKVYADSASQVEFLVENKVVRPDHISVLGAGSLGGIDYRGYRGSSELDRTQALERAGVDPDSFRFLYVGRLNRDKGLREAVDAFKRLKEENEKVSFILVGPHEFGSGRLPEDLIEEIASSEGIFEVGYVDNPSLWFDVGDVLLLPSYREGFGTVVLEAALSHTPTIGTDIYGLRDAIVDGVTGELVPLKSVDKLYEVMRRFMDDRELVEQYAENASTRVKNEFDYEIIATLLLADYEAMTGLEVRDREV